MSRGTKQLPPFCLDCGAEVVGPFCGQCGQRHRAGPLPLHDLIAEVSSDLFSVDGRLARTLWPLLSRPGFLTNEYLAGRRTRYTPPFRLYLGISVLYFLVLIATDSNKFFVLNVWSEDNTEFGAFVRLLPRLMFLLLPAFALIQAVLYRRSGRLYAEHLVFALHFHAFSFLVLPLDALLNMYLRAHLTPPVGVLTVAAVVITGVVELSVVVYLHMALRRAYGGSWLGTVTRTVVLVSGYLFMLLAVALLFMPSMRTTLWTLLRAGDKLEAIPREVAATREAPVDSAVTVVDSTTLATDTSTFATPLELAALSAKLDVPVQGILRSQLRDTYGERRGDHAHEALDILAARGTPIQSATDGRLLRLFDSKAGGLMVYATDASERFILLYGHMDRYAEGLTDGMQLERGQVIGYVGTTGNAAAGTPHLHFGILRGDPAVSWARGAPVNPYPLLVPATSSAR